MFVISSLRHFRQIYESFYNYHKNMYPHLTNARNTVRNQNATEMCFGSIKVVYRGAKNEYSIC